MALAVKVLRSRLIHFPAVELPPGANKVIEKIMNIIKYNNCI